VGPLCAIVGHVIAALETWLVYKAMRNTRRARLLARVPWSKIGQLQPGLVKGQGQASAIHGTLRSLLSGRECVHYHFQVEAKRQRGGDRVLGQWVGRLIRTPPFMQP